MDLIPAAADHKVVSRRMTRSMTLARRSNGSQTRETFYAASRVHKERAYQAKSGGNVRPSKDLNAQLQLKLSHRSPPPGSAETFGLVQERIADNLYFLVLQAILWNQTTGRQARPVFEKLVRDYPSPAHLACASLPALTAALQPIGLHNIRAARCIKLGQRWCEQPPCSSKRYVRKGYPVQVVDEDSQLGWEIAHLPGVGPYALDSYRIFHRDQLRGLAQDWLGTGATTEGFEPEWKRVVPADKELRAYLKWMWLKHGWLWDERSGKRRKIVPKRQSEGGGSVVGEGDSI